MPHLVGPGAHAGHRGAGGALAAWTPTPPPAAPGRTTRAAKAFAPPRTVALAALVAVLVAGAVLPGCRVGGGRSVASENTRLRQVNLDYQRQVDRLESRLVLKEGQIATLTQQLEQAAPPMDGAEVPVLSRIELGRFTAGYDTTGDGRDDTLRVYVRTLDQHGRMLPVAGRARVRAVVVPAEGEPRVLAERVYEPREWDAAYRAGFTGTHYTLELSLPNDIRAGAGDTGTGVDGVVAGVAGVGVAGVAGVHVHFHDAATGARLRAERTVELTVP
ncbi:MAG: hypothetical protein WD009_04320 [Phycisphaeraceae bacterium]